MMQFFTDYAPQIISTVTIVSIYAPMIRKRIVSDKNMLLKFDDIKALTKTVLGKEVDFDRAIRKVDDSILRIEKEVNSSIKAINDNVLEFTESELYTKMLSGLSQLDELSHIIQNKDATIRDYKLQLKKINKRLGVIESERKL